MIIITAHDFLLFAQTAALFAAIYYLSRLADAWTERDWRRRYRLHWFTGRPR